MMKQNIERLPRMFGLAILALLCAGPERADAQDCQAILNQLLSGHPGYGSAERATALGNQYNNCMAGQQQQAPVYQQQQQQPYQLPQSDFANTPVIRELTALSTLTSRNQPLRQDIPLSSGTVMMELVPAPPPAPRNYVDPFAARSFPAITSSAAGPVRRGSIWDPSQWVTMQPPKTNTPSSPQLNSSGTYTNPKNCTFDSPSCR